MKKRWRRSANRAIRSRVSSMCLCILLLLNVGCVWIKWDPDVGRVLFTNSRAQVGPLETESGEKVAIPDSTSENLVKESIPMSGVAPQNSTEPESVSDTNSAKSSVTSLQAPNSVENESAPKNTKPARKSDNFADLAKADFEPIKPTLEPGKPNLKKPIKPTSEAISDSLALANPQPPKILRGEIAQIPSPDSAQSNRPKTATIIGAIRVLDSNQQPVQISGALVRLIRADGGRIRPRPILQSHTIEMRNKSYAPGFLTMSVGESLYFTNQDKIKHNVFSSTGENAFDLGTYGSGLRRGVALVTPGIVKVYCNIHPQMATFVAVEDGGVAAIAGSADGAFTLESIPEGEYLLTVWHVRGEKTVAIALAEGESKNILIELDTSEFEAQERINKFGQKYKGNIAIFDDEFY